MHCPHVCLFYLFFYLYFFFLYIFYYTTKSLSLVWGSLFRSGLRLGGGGGGGLCVGVVAVS